MTEKFFQNFNLHSGWKSAADFVNFLSLILRRFIKKYGQNSKGFRKQCIFRKLHLSMNSCMAFAVQRFANRRYNVPEDLLQDQRGTLQIMVVEFHTENSKIVHYCLTITSHLAYVATLTKSDGVKIDGFLYPNFMQIPKM